MKAEQKVEDIFDARWSSLYRRGDDAATGHGSREHYCRILRDLTAGFGGGGTVVLDVGCGTGRYFHCLRNVRRLIGIDVSPHMLSEARRPVRGDEISIAEIDLRCCEIGSPDLPLAAFDVVYSVGVFGEYTPVNAALLRRFQDLLAPGGQLFFTAVETHSRFQMPENAEPTRSRRMLRRLFPLLPAAGRRAMNRAFSSCYLTEGELAGLLRNSGFASFQITHFRHPSGWNGTHLDCHAVKSSPLPAPASSRK